MIRNLVLSFVLLAVSMAHASEQIRSTVVQITGPNTKTIVTQLNSRLSELNPSIGVQKKNWIPEFISVLANFNKLDRRETLSLMRALSVEAANCPDQSELVEPTERNDFLTRCYSHAISENMWNSLNYGAWDLRAKNENKVTVVSYGVSLTYKNLTKAEFAIVKQVVSKIAAELKSVKATIPSQIFLATFE